MDVSEFHLVIMVFRKETAFLLCFITPYVIACVCRCSKCAPKYVVENAEGEAIFTIEGPICACQCICCPRDIEFPVSRLIIVIYLTSTVVIVGHT